MTSEADNAAPQQDEAEESAAAERVRTFPTTPGVYLMKDARDRVIYVGKAVNLRNRAASYFTSAARNDRRTAELVREIADVDCIETDSEVDALLMEARLIKDIQPRFNSQLRDDKTFPYLQITTREDFPRIEFTRTPASKGVRLYGPFTNAGKLRGMIAVLQKIFRFRTCSLDIEESDERWRWFRPCILASINQCTAPCSLQISREDYRNDIRRLRLFLDGGRDRLLKQMQKEMHEASDGRLYEKAASIRDDIEALYADVEQLDNRDPDSTAAAEGAFALARFTHTMARGHAGRSVDWVREFSRQARSFAGRFPDQAYRFVPQLFAAARSCELHNLNTEAIHCYTMLKDHFTETIQGQQSISILRRLNLVGQRPEIAGSTPDGGDVAIGDYAGRVVLVVFWSSENTTFRKLAPTLVELSRDYRKNGLEILGVNLDKEETDVDGFLEKVALPGRHIFFSHRDQRRWENPIAKFYGISDIPTLWLVDRQGRVVNTRVTSEALDRDVRKLLAAGRRTASND